MENNSRMHWIVAMTLCGLTISAVGLPVMTNGVFITPIADSLDVYRGSVAMHNTMTLLMKAFVSLYVPVLLRKYSFKKVIIVGTILGGVSNYFLGWVDEIWLFNILGTIRGIGTGLVAWVPLTIVVNEWFEKRHGLVMSLVLSFSSITGAVFSPIFTSLISEFGWAQTYRIMGILMIVFALPAILIPYTVDPRKSGYLPYGLSPTEEKKLKSRSESEKRLDGKKVSMFLFSLLFVFALFETLLIGVPQHFPGFAQSLGFSLDVGATMLSAAMISSVGFKLGLGYISDHIGPVKSTLSILALVGLSSVVLFMTETASLLYIGAFFFGAVFSVPSVSTTLLTKEFFGRVNFARLYPILAFSTSIGGAVSLSVVGFIYDFTGSYLPAFAIALGINIFNILVLSFIANRSIRVTKGQGKP